jgi:hypothetical protein
MSRFFANTSPLVFLLFFGGFSYLRMSPRLIVMIIRLLPRFCARIAHHTLSKLRAHKSQGSEFGAMIIPVRTRQFKMLFWNLIYTGLTRAKNLAVFVGTCKVLAMAVKNQDTSQRQTFLQKLLA